MKNEKPLKWEGSSYTDLLNFPEYARRSAGFELHKVQHGEMPDNWKPFKGIGAGVTEIRISEESEAYRVLYVAKFDEAIYVLHAFQKKTQATSKHDKDIATARYQHIVSKRGKK
jgi:phage-related protein